VQTWRLSDRSPVTTIELPEDGHVHLLSFSQDGRTLAAASAQALFLLDPNTGELLRRIDLQQGTTALFSPTDAEMLVLQSPTHTVRGVNWRTGELWWETAEMAERPHVVRLTPDGVQVLTAGSERSVRIWDVPSGAFRRELRGHRGVVQDIDVSPDGRTVATLDEYGVLKLWHRATGKFLMDVEAPPGGIQRWCRFSPHGRWLATRHDPHTVYLFPLRQEEPFDTASELPVNVTDDQDAGGSADTALPLPERKELYAPADLQNFVDLDYSPDGASLAASSPRSGDNATVVFDLPDGDVRHVFSHPGYFDHVISRFSPDGARLYVLVTDQKIRKHRIAHWNARTGAGPQVEPILDVHKFSLLPAGNRLVVGYYDGGGASVAVWDCDSDRVERELHATPGRISALHLSSDGTEVFVANRKSLPVVIDLSTGAYREIGSPGDDCLDGAFHPAGGRLALALHPGPVVLYDLATRYRLRSIPGRAIPCAAIDYSPDGRLLAVATGEADSDPPTVVTVWDSAAQRCLYTLPVEGFHVPRLAWSPDSRTLAAVLYRTPSRPGPAVVLWRFTEADAPAPETDRTNLRR
jgi:WD40 repeat protein